MDQEKLQRLQAFEQNLQAMLVQKQQFQAQLFEIDGALKELSGTKQAFRILGNIMVESDPNALQQNLREQRDVLELRITAVDKQEKQFREKAKKLQEEVMAGMK